MSTRIRIKAGSLTVDAELNDTPTAQEIAGSLPIAGEVSRWGEEIYFAIPVKRKLEEGARADVEVGEIGYWPSGNAFCIFFGPTPASSTAKPRAASAVTIIGKVIGEAQVLTKVKEGTRIELESAAGK